MTKDTVFDLDFGLNQLSGNQSLLFKLLDKFVDEYQNVANTLTTQFANEQWHEATVLIHTLKGVSGNLGFVALHKVCRDIELHVKEHRSSPTNFDHFISILNASFHAIESAKNQSGQENQSSSNSNENTSVVALREALGKHEFIPTEQLEEWLSSIPLAENVKENLRLAIDELDYEEALTLLQSA